LNGHFSRNVRYLLVLVGARIPISDFPEGWEYLFLVFFQRGRERNPIQLIVNNCHCLSDSRNIRAHPGTSQLFQRNPALLACLWPLCHQLELFDTPLTCKQILMLKVQRPRSLKLRPRRHRPFLFLQASQTNFLKYLSLRRHRIITRSSCVFLIVVLEGGSVCAGFLDNLFSEMHEFYSFFQGLEFSGLVY
jgi:hypothetical protein